MKSSRILLRLWLLCTTTIFLFDEARGQGQCLEHHKSLLLDLKRSLVINEAISDAYGTISKLSQWNASTNCCLWPGVTCSGKYVTGLDLGNEPIVGGFNESSPLFHLTSLTNLNLAWMTQYGQYMRIPSGIGRLVNLMNLNLSGASFIGQIPIEVSNLTRLVSLDFSYCQLLKAENPNLGMLVRNLSNLINLRLSEVDLSSQSREWCQTLSSSTPLLQVLDLHECRLSGPIQDSLQNLTHLSYVDLSYSNFSGQVPHRIFSNLKNLTSLALIGCEFYGVFPHEMLQLPNLRALGMSQNHFLEPSSSITFVNSSFETLVLSGTRFSKIIPESIGEARMLSYLDISGCNLSGQIPKSMSQLEHLIYLEMSNNNLVGHIPSFSRSKNLTSLDMHSNHLNGSILATDWKRLPQMKVLMLRSNGLSGSIPASLFETPSLVELDLERNHFSDFTMESNLTTSSSSLERLYLGDNDLQGSFPPFIYELFQSLQVLDLSFNDLSNTFVLDSSIQDPHDNNIPSFPLLDTLGLAYCNLKEFPLFFANQSQLRRLDLSGNQMAGHIQDHIKNMSALAFLNISHNQLDYLGSDEFGSRLQILDLSFNKLHGSIPKSICNLTYPFILDFSNNLFSGTLPSQCWSWTDRLTLFVLNLRNNNISGSIPDIFAFAVNLETLDLSQNSFQGEIPKSLARCLSLKVLDLGYNKLHDKFPCWLNNLDQLRVLVLRSNSLYGSVQCLNYNFNWTRLQIMDIASNNFGGNLPSQGLRSWEAMMAHKYSATEPGDLNYLQIGIFDWQFTNTALVTVKGLEWYLTKISSFYTLVDFSDNKFEGEIPHELGELSFLYALNLSHNYLRGKIPPSFGNLSRIESLDLSNNDLSGKITEQLAALDFLSFLNLSFNRLEGMIPKGRQFQTFDEASFKGNKGLCGQPLNISCGNEGVRNPSNPSSEAEDEAKDDLGNIFIATQIGYTLGLGLIIIPLLLWSRWRKRYYECIDKVLNSIFCCKPKKSPLPKKVKRRI